MNRRIKTKNQKRMKAENRRVNQRKSQNRSSGDHVEGGKDEGQVIC
jgi:hypothetical protein